MPALFTSNVPISGETQFETLKKIACALTGNGSPSSIDPSLFFAKGEGTGQYSINKYGRSTNVDSGINTDIWDRANATDDQDVWVAPTEARVHAIVSTSDEDSAPGGVVAEGTGAKTIQVYGLPSWSEREISEVITMDGTTAVNTVNSYVIIHRMKVLTKGGNAGGPNVGVITATAATDSTVTAQINAAEGQTQMCIYGIPSIQTLYMTNFYCDMLKSGSAARAIISLLVNPEPDSELINFLVKTTRNVERDGTSSWQHFYNTYNKIEGPAIIKIRANGSAANLDISGGFGGIILDN